MRKLLQFFGKEFADSNDEVGQAFFNAINAIFSIALKDAETKLNQGDGFNKENLLIAGIMQTFMSHPDGKKRSMQ